MQQYQPVRPCCDIHDTRPGKFSYINSITIIPATGYRRPRLVHLVPLGDLPPSGRLDLLRCGEKQQPSVHPLGTCRLHRAYSGNYSLFHLRTELDIRWRDRIDLTSASLSTNQNSLRPVKTIVLHIFFWIYDLIVEEALILGGDSAVADSDFQSVLVGRILL